jgi:hypothetical protein
VQDVDGDRQRTAYHKFVGMQAVLGAGQDEIDLHTDVFAEDAVHILSAGEFIFPAGARSTRARRQARNVLGIEGEIATAQLAAAGDGACLPASVFRRRSHFRNRRLHFYNGHVIAVFRK